MIAFAPVTNKDGSLENSRDGYLQVRAYLQRKITKKDWNGILTKFINLLRINEIDIFDKNPDADIVPLPPEPTPEPKPEPKPKPDDKNTTDNTNKTDSNDN